jgi:hypothetical protein
MIGPNGKGFPLFFKDLFHIVQAQLDSDNELLVVLVELVNITSAVKTPVQDDIDLLVAHHIKLCHELPDGLHIGDVAGQFSIVEGKAGFFSEEQGQINLGQSVDEKVKRRFDILFKF